MSVTAGDTPVPSPGTHVCRALLLGLDGEQKGVWLCFYPPKCDDCSCGSSRAPIRAVSFKAGKETVPFAVPWHPRRCCATLSSARPCPVRGEILSAPSCHPIHTSLSLLKEHPAPTGLNTDPELPSQLCLSPFCSLQLGALSALPPLPNLALPPKPFSPRVFCSQRAPRSSCFFCTNCFSLAHCVESAKGGAGESQLPSHLRSHILPLSEHTSRAGNKTARGGCFPACLRILWRLECARTLLPPR